MCLTLLGKAEGGRRQGAGDVAIKKKADESI